MTQSHKKMPQVLLCQFGARRRYVVPALLEQAGMLAGLYTDSSALSHVGSAVKLFDGCMPSSLKRLARREIKGIPPSRVFSSDAPLLYETTQTIMGRRKRGMMLYLQRHRILSKRMMKRGLQNADIVYSMYYENLAFIRWAKSQGLKSVVDVYISPISEEIMADERKRFPDWETAFESEIPSIKDQLWHETARLADLLICPSEWVAEGVVVKTPEAAQKICIVPYGCSVDYAGRTNYGIKNRIFFAGGDALRKGLHYLAEATVDMETTLPDLDIRVAGLMPQKISQHPLCSHLNFLGKLNVEQMKEEYLSADVFVLPTLSEGFAGVVAEAMVAGCPVITTKQAGSPLVDGREGLLVPPSDSMALRSAILRMLQDRDFRNKCSKASLALASIFSHDAWKERLVKSICEVAD